VDGNRTRRTGFARPTRFEGGGAHQVPGHLLGAGTGPVRRPYRRVGYLGAMKKLLLIVVILGLSAFAVRKLRVG
jgi:hypothetical protein